MFQFKIHYHIKYTRDKLFKAKITDSDSCHVCESKQTLEHLFAKCQHVHSFSNLSTLWWNDMVHVVHGIFTHSPARYLSPPQYSTWYPGW